MAKFAPVYMTVYDGEELGVIGSSALTFDDAAAAGTVIGAITGKTAGSTLAVTVNGTKVGITGNNFVVGTGNTPGALAVTVTETMAGYENSPKATVINFTVT